MRLAGYTTREVVHEGAKSEIHRATRDADGRQVILKIPRAGALTHQRLAELRHEHYVASRLKSEGVVEVLALEERGAHPFLVFEDFGGVSLDRAFAGKIGLASFYRVALQICDALVHIHGCGVIHKDIKPHNILISQRTGTVKITDLAIASLLTNEASSLAPADHLVGTIAYMAPEQTGRIGQGIDTRADLYALGVTFFELLSGRRPFPQTEPMELIHAHIAREPPRLVDVEPSVGPELSAVVARLLAKNPDERYRSALSLRADLIFLQGRQRSGGDEPFEPGQRCRAAEFRLPQRLYGREREVERLLRAFSHAAADARALVLIAGSSGTGKSALVHEVHRPMVAKRGSFIAGKFDQYNRSVPFSALLQTLRQLIDLVLAGSDAEVEEWRRRLLDALGSQVAVLVDTVPELEHVVGKQPPPTTVSSTEAQNRLHLAVLRFLSVFARADHPLVIFLDDLQWADVATVALLKALVTDPEIDNVLVIGAYRDREVGAGHPLLKAIAEIKASPTRLEEIQLGPLVARDVLRMVADALAADLDDVRALADEVFRRTEGNPLFVREFLRMIYGDNLLRYDAAAERWTWDVAEIRAVQCPDDVTGLLLERIERLSERAREVLKIAACIGIRFGLHDLIAVADASEAEVGRALWEAIEGGLMTAADANYRLLLHGGERLANFQLRFLHDRVRQAVYSLLSDDELPPLHLAVGRRLLDSLPHHDRAELLDAVDHLNRGRAELRGADELLTLTRLNLEAGDKAKAATAYAAAVTFYRAGVSLVDDATWQRHYRLAFALHLGLAEAEYLSGDVERSEAAFDVATARANNTLDALTARSRRAVLYVAIGRSERAIEVGVDAMRSAGLAVPDDEEGLRAATAAEKALLRERLAGRSLRALVDLDEARDPEVRALIKVITNLLAPTQLTRQRLFEYLCIKQLNLSLEHGHAAASPFGYLVYCFYLTTTSGAIPEAYALGEAALEINDRLGNDDQIASVNFVFGSILHHFRPLREVLELFERARHYGLESGDYIFVSYACSHAAIAQFGLGTPLDAISPQVDDYLRLMQRTRVASSTAALVVVRQLVAALRGDTVSPTSFTDDGYDEDAAFAAYEGARLTFATLWLSIAKLAICYIARDFDGARRWLAEADGRLLNSSWYLTTELAFYACLFLAREVREADDDERAALRERLDARREHYASLAASCPENFAFKLDLIDAEIAAADGDTERALAGYDRAIEGARNLGSLAIDALARELAGRLLIERGQRILAATLLADAESMYRRWGALTKADALVAEFGAAFRGALVRASTRGAADEITHASITATTIDPRLDLSSAIKAAEAFSGEIDLALLLKKVMRVLVEHAGAERGVLALAQDGRLDLAATYASDEGVVLHDQRPLDGAVAPAALLRNTLRTGRTILSEDVDDNPSFASDPYVAATRPLSLLSTPVAYRGRRLGVLYLENRLVWGAFNHYRMEMLRLLCAQLAISIENARVFSELSEARRTAEEASLAKSRFMLNMSHELRTPLNWVIGISEMLAEEAEDDGNDDTAAELVKITDAGRHLLGIITNVLDITKLESGRLSLELSTFALAPVIDELLATHLVNAERAGSTIDVDVADGIGELTNDRVKLVQVLGNVLDNAIRFGEGGAITLRAREVDGRVQIAVRDHGIGMTEDQRAKIFDAFSQADDSPTRQYGGMGIGLAIVHRLAALMGGSIDVDSELGVGSTFTIDVPLVVSA